MQFTTLIGLINEFNTMIVCCFVTYIQAEHETCSNEQVYSQYLGSFHTTLPDLVL